jgi:hypothetical protein
MEGQVLMSDVVEQGGYLRELKTAVVKAMRNHFGPNYGDPRLSNLHVSIEYPIDQQSYPSIWVTYEDAVLRNAGIDHFETSDDGTRVLRWHFEGVVNFTVAALTSLERDRIYDEMVKVVAFSRGIDSVNPFRASVENSPFIAMNFDFDTIEPQGESAAPGTPWETDEIIYERGIGLQVVGEFVASLSTGNLLPLSKILIQGRLAPSTEDAPVGEQDWTIDRNISPDSLGTWF